MSNPAVKQALSNFSKGRTLTTGLSNQSSANRMYDDLFKANPYTGLTYHQSGWQQFLSKLGFRTDADRWLEEAQANAAEYDSQVASIMQQNEYNSPSAEAQRMREAGLNPDLLGTQGVAESASPIQDPQGMSSGVDETAQVQESMNKLMNFASGVMSCFQMATGFAKDMISMRQMQNAVRGQDVDLAKQFLGFANDLVLQHSPAQPFENDEQFHDHVSKVSDILYGYPKVSHMSRRARKIWYATISRDYFNSPDFERLTSSWKNIKQNTESIAKTNGYLGRLSLNSDVDSWKAFNTVSTELGKLADDMFRLEHKRFKAVSESEISGADANKQVYDAQRSYRDIATGSNYGQMKAAAEGAEFGVRFHQASIDKAMNSTLSRIATKLEQDANDGDLLSAGLLLAFNIFKLSNFKVR